MSMIKKITAAAIAACVGLTLCGCSGGEAENNDGKLSVITTIYPAYDFARQVFGDTAEVTLLLKPGMESHSYDPSAKDVVKINSCDLFIYNGGESDQWVNSILDGTDELNTLRMMDTVELSEAQHEEHEGGEHSHEESEYDEHIWTSPRNAVKIVEAVRAEAAELAPDNAEIYNGNAAKYSGEISDLDARFTELLMDEQRYFVFGDRFPLLYFFKDYNLNHYSAFSGCGAEVEPSAAVISDLLGKLRGEDVIKGVFCIELSNHKLADTLAADSGLTSREFHTCHNITADDFNAGETYVTLMERNYTMLKEVLEK